MNFKQWLLQLEAIDANTKELLQKAKAPKDELDAFVHDPNNMVRNTYDMPREYLDFNKLNRKAVKITQPGAGNIENQNEFIADNHEWSFSVVSPFNKTWNIWPVKPISEKYVAQTDWLNGKQNNGKPNLDDAKYQQIVISAKKLGLM